MADSLRCHHHRRRSRRLRRGDPRGAARLQDGGRRARASRRHLPQLGLHSHQGAAALGRDLPLHAARRGLWPERRGHGRLRHRRRRQALARRPAQLNGGVGFLMKKNKVDVIWGEATHHQARRGRGRQADQEAAMQPQHPAPKGTLGAGHLHGQAHHRRHRRAARACCPASSRTAS